MAANPIQEWLDGFNEVLPRIPTIRKLFGDAWLNAETLRFKNATHQDACHPLVGLLVNKGGNPGKIGHDAQFIEDIFCRLELRISGKVSEIKTQYTEWHKFLSVFGELLIAFHLDRSIPTVRIEPPRTGTKKVPDLDWKVNGHEIGIEVNAVSETGEIRSDRDDYQEQLNDAIVLSRLVTRYRESQKIGAPIPAEVQARINEVVQYDKLWEDPAPRVFGGVPPIRPRYVSHGKTLGNLRLRKADAVQVATYKYKILGLILPDEYFLFPYSFIRLFDVTHKADPAVRYRVSGIVYKAFYGLRGEPIFGYNNVDSKTGKAYAVREYDQSEGRFISQSKFDAAILCSIATSQGRITTPISYQFLLYEPFAKGNISRLIPYFAFRKLAAALGINRKLSRRVCRIPGAQFLRSRCFLHLRRCLTKPRVIKRYRSILWQYAALTNVSMVLFVCERQNIKTTIVAAMKYLGQTALIERLAFADAADWKRDPARAPIRLGSSVIELAKVCVPKTTNKVA